MIDLFEAYNKARERERAGIAYRGYILKRVDRPWDDAEAWTITRGGYQIGYSQSRQQAEREVDNLLD